MLFFNKNKNKLIFNRQYTSYGAYSSKEKFKTESVEEILSRYKSKKSVDGIEGTVCIESKFNNKIYPVFDLDNQVHFDLFKTVFSETPYVLFKSSDEHYWGILDTPCKHMKDIYENYNWKIINDSNYCGFSKSFNKLYIRGLYESKDRKPVVYEINGNLSENFQMFISKLEYYYNNECLELSILRYRNHDMLLQYNRKIKIRNIDNYE